MNRINWETYFDAVRERNWEVAKNALQNISADETENPNVFLKQGDMHRKTGDTAGAIAAYHRSARLLRAQGFNQKAVALYKIILRMDPKDEDAMLQSAEVIGEIEVERRCAHMNIPARDLFPADPGRIAPPRAGAAKVPVLFSGMSVDEYRKALDGLEIKSFLDKEKVIEEGDSGDSLFLIESGNARVSAHLLGKEVELAVLGEGDVFGEVAFLTGRPRTAEVAAMGPLKVLEIGRLDIERIIERNPEVLSRLEDFYDRRAKDTIVKIRARPKNT